MLQRLGALVLDILEVVVFSAAIFLFVYYLVLQPHKIDGPSMLPTLHDRDYIFTDKLTYRFKEPKRGDIIVFQPPEAAAHRSSKDFIKRIIGLPGEEVKVDADHVYINGNLLEETYLPFETKTFGSGFLEDGQTITVPPNSFFVMGDNREYSSDSRSWGFVTKGSITGKAWVHYWPLDKFGTLPVASYTI